MGFIGDIAQIGFQIEAVDRAKKEGQRKQDWGSRLMIESDIDKELLGDRPKMSMPQSQLDFVNLMNLNRRQEMPGMSQMLAQQEQAGATTRGAAANLSGADAAAVLLGEGQDRMRGLRQIGLSAAQYGQQQNMAYAGAVQSNAPWEQQMWQQNQMYPWEIGRNEAQQKWNVGAQMNFGGGDQMAAAGIHGANMMSGNINQWQQNPNSWMNNMNWGGQQPRYNAGAVSQGMQNRTAYNPPQGTYDQLPFG